MWLQSFTKGHLKINKMSVHENIKYPCNICDYKATHQVSLKRQKMSIHEGEGIKYHCNQCEYKAAH